MGSPTAVDHVLALLLGIVLPLLSVLIGHGALRGETFDRSQKFALFRGNSIALWVAATAVIGVWLLADRSLRDLGLAVPRGSWPAALLTLAIALSFVLDSWLQVRTPERRRKACERLRRDTPFLPTSRAEFVPYALMAVSAGVCEEVLFRGHLIRYVQAMVGDSPSEQVVAVGLPAIVFALDSGASRPSSQRIGTPWRSMRRNHVSCRLANCWIATLSASNIRRRVVSPRSCSVTKRYSSP